MLTKQEVEILRQNARVHRKVFEEIRKMLKDWTTAVEVDKMCGEIAKKNNVLCGFRWLYWFPSNICISTNDLIAHGIPHKWLIFRDWDLVNFDFGIKDKQKWISTDAWISLIVWWDDKNPLWAKLIQANKDALYAWIDKCRVWNTVWDISAAVQEKIEWAWFKVVKDLTGHALWKKMHEKPYIPNYWIAWTWAKIKEWMTLCIEPILWATSWKMVEEWVWPEYFTDDWSLSSQYEHLILVTKWDPEIII